jgi:hypothetical protein
MMLRAPNTAAESSQKRWAWTFVALLVIIVVVVGLWIAHASTKSSAVSAATCQTITGTLGNGPDPDVDPVGYAQAQVLPLSAIKTNNPALNDALAKLSSAYGTFVKENGSKQAGRAVTSASNQLDLLCPGATS